MATLAVDLRLSGTDLTCGVTPGCSLWCLCLSRVSAKRSRFHLCGCVLSPDPRMQCLHLANKRKSFSRQTLRSQSYRAEYIHNPVWIQMYFCPTRGLHTLPPVCLPPTTHPPSCGYTTGEKCGPVTISQKTPAGWLSWRLLTSA